MPLCDDPRPADGLLPAPGRARRLPDRGAARSSGGTRRRPRRVRALVVRHGPGQQPAGSSTPPPVPSDSWRSRSLLPGATRTSARRARPPRTDAGAIAGVTAFAADTRSPPRPSRCPAGCSSPSLLAGVDGAVELPVPGPVVDPRLSPDGRQVAYVVDGAVRVAAAADATRRRCSRPSRRRHVRTRRLLAAEELARSAGTGGGPRRPRPARRAGRRVAGPAWWIATPRTRTGRRPHRYPAAGTANPSCPSPRRSRPRHPGWCMGRGPAAIPVPRHRPWSADHDPLLSVA